eukprot:365700-Chlamydomonas_euryale.AAC.4
MYPTPHPAPNPPLPTPRSQSDPPFARIVLAQLEGSGRGALGAYNQTDYETLSGLLQAEPVRDGDEWLAKLMRKNSLLGGWCLGVGYGVVCRVWAAGPCRVACKVDAEEQPAGCGVWGLGCGVWGPGRVGGVVGRSQGQPTAYPTVWVRLGGRKRSGALLQPSHTFQQPKRTLA